MKKQKNNEKKEKVLKILKYIGLGLCWTILLIGFLALLINGIKGCSTASEKSKAIKQRANNIQLRADNNNDIQTYYYFDEDKVRGAWQSWQTSVDNFAFAAPHDDDPYSASCRAWGRMNDLNGSHEFRAILYRYDVAYESWSAQPVMRLTYVLLQNFNTGWSKVVYDSANNIFDNSAFTLEGDFGAIENLSNSTITESETGSFSYFWLGSVVLDISNTTTFTFNDIINYNGYFNASLNSPYITYSNLSTNIDTPFFVSGGNLYNQIHLQFIDAYGSYYADNTGSTFILTANPNTYMTYLYMEYVNTLTGLTTLVNTRDIGVHYNGSSNYNYNLNSSSWVSQYYRYINLIDEDDDILIELSKFNSNVGSNTGVGHSNGDLSNGFNLLTSAFASLLPILTLQVLPGITLGLLIFLPIMATIIVLIFKAVKK